MPLEELLELQAADIKLDQIEHHWNTIPAREQLVAANAELAAIDTQLEAANSEHHKVAAEEKRLDDEARSIEAKAADMEKRMAVSTSPKELQAMQSDVEQLKHLQMVREDEELVVMEQREGLDNQINAINARREAVAAAAAEASTNLSSQESEIFSERQVAAAAREEIASRIDPDLLVEYDKRRASNRGIGAAKLIGVACDGCKLTIPTGEAERIRKTPNEISFCDNCGCILVPS